MQTSCFFPPMVFVLSAPTLRFFVPSYVIFLFLSQVKNIHIPRCTCSPIFIIKVSCNWQFNNCLIMVSKKNVIPLNMSKCITWYNSITTIFFIIFLIDFSVSKGWRCQYIVLHSLGGMNALVTVTDCSRLSESGSAMFTASWWAHSFRGFF